MGTGPGRLGTRVVGGGGRIPGGDGGGGSLSGCPGDAGGTGGNRGRCSVGLLGGCVG